MDAKAQRNFVSNSTIGRQFFSEFINFHILFFSENLHFQTNLFHFFIHSTD